MLDEVPTKICKLCKEEKTATKEIFAWTTRNGMSQVCKRCRNRRYYTLRGRKPIPKTKVCWNCKIEKPWNAEFFARNRAFKSGFSYLCKDCVTPVNRERYSERMKEQTKRAAAKRINNPEWKRRHRARTALGAAVRYGRIRKPQECSDCGKEKPLEGHHHKGYEPKHWLDVVWLCKRCHGKLFQPAMPAETLPCLAIENTL